jgi:hypothetical protein
MPAVIPFIPLIAAGIGGGAAVISGVVQSNAAKSVAQTQANSAAQALAVEQANAKASLAFAQQQWQQTQSNLAPYLAAGQATLGRLMSGLGITPPPASSIPTTSVPGLPNSGAGPIPGTTVPAAVQAGANPPPSASPSAAPAPPTLQTASLSSLYPTGATAPQGGVPGNPQLPAGPSAPPPPQGASTMSSSVANPMQSGYGSQSGNAGQSRVQWPDGTVMSVNSDDLAQYTQLGAQVLA